MEFLDITSTGWSAIIVSLSMSILAGMMFTLGNRRVHYIWGVFSIAVVIWASAFYVVTLTNDAEMAKFWWKISFTGLILNPFIFFHFVLEFIDNAYVNKIKWKILLPLYTLLVIFLFLNLTTDLIVKEVTFLFGEVFYNTPPGTLHPYFMIIFIGLIIYAHYLVYKEYKEKQNDKLFRQRATYFFLATIIAYIGGAMNFLPVYGIEVPPITSLAVAIGSGIIAYAILRYQLFNARVVTAQLLTFILVTFAIVRLVVSDSIEWIIFNTLLLAVTLIVGLVLIRSVKREVEAREKLEVLTKELEKANERLKELDQLKTEFLSLASHQFRSPLSAIKGYTSLILEGSYGEINPAVKEAVSKVFISSNNLVGVVQDFLDVSRIEQGSMKYDMEKLDIKGILKEVIDGLKPNIEGAGLKISLDAPDGPYLSNVDKNKFNQVLINLIDNAQKYTKTGSINIYLTKENGRIRVEVRDTGVGIAKEEIPKLFNKFVRSKDANEINTKGTGLGLYIVKKIVEAHKGRIWVESEGVGRGSSFFVELDEA